MLPSPHSLPFHRSVTSDKPPTETESPPPFFSVILQVLFLHLTLTLQQMDVFTRVLRILIPTFRHILPHGRPVSHGDVRKRSLAKEVQAEGNAEICGLCPKDHSDGCYDGVGYWAE